MNRISLSALSNGELIHAAFDFISQLDNNLHHNYYQDDRLDENLQELVYIQSLVNRAVYMLNKRMDEDYE